MGLYERIMTLLERLIFSFITLVSVSYYTEAKLNIKASEKLLEQIKEKNQLKDKIESMSHDEKASIAIRD